MACEVCASHQTGGQILTARRVYRLGSFHDGWRNALSMNKKTAGRGRACGGWTGKLNYPFNLKGGTQLKIYLPELTDIQ